MESPIIYAKSVQDLKVFLKDNKLNLSFVDSKNKIYHEYDFSVKFDFNLSKIEPQ